MPSTMLLTPCAGYRIMYVDDDDALVFLCDRALTKRGHTLTCFLDSNDALAHFQTYAARIDVIVTDLAMPRMSGFQFAQAALHIRPDIPIILMTGYVTAQEQATAERIGIRAVVAKPNSVDELTQTIDEMLREELPLGA